MKSYRLFLWLKASAFILISLAISSTAFTQVTNTIAPGNWSDSGKWSNGVPANSGTSTITNKMTIDQDITIEGTCTANNTMTDNSGGDQYKASMLSFGIFNVNNNVTFEGEVKLSGNSSVIISGCAVFTVGDLLIENDATFSVSACSKLVVNGNLTIKNEVGITCDGIIEVYGDVNATNNSSVTGTGSLVATGSVSISSPATIFGSGSCVAPQCTPGAPLPIDLLSFEANVNGDEVDVKWITATEINNDYFTVERSVDAKNWEEVIITCGAGNSNQTIDYFEVDYEPLTDISYYRLKQTDFDGEFSYSNIVPVKFVKDNIDGNISLFPSPVSNGETVHVEFKNIFEAELLVVLRDIKGREFYSKVIVNIEDGKLIGVPIENEIPAGIYLITASSDNQMYSQKLIIK